MSRRSQATRRRNYGRRQHEVRQRRDGRINGDWSAQLADDESSRDSRSDAGQLPGSMEAGRQ
jgi:hypothetical protein